MIKNIQEVKNSKKCLVKCGAQWCSSCHQQDKLFEEHFILEMLNKQGIDYFYADADDDANSDFYETYKIQSLPTILFFKDGNLKEILKGYTGITKLKESIQKLEE